MAKIGKREAIVKIVVREKFNWVVGGYINNVMDRLIPCMPSREQLIIEIYNEVITADSVETPIGMIEVKKDIRFAGKELILKYIENILTEEEYNTYIELNT